MKAPHNHQPDCKALLDDRSMLQIIKIAKPKYKDEKQAIDQTYRSDGYTFKAICDHYSRIEKRIEVFLNDSRLRPLACG